MENKSGTNVESNIAYYNDNAEEFINSTVNVDMNTLYSAFEKYLFPGCRVLDLGSGSGRDSKYFAKKGYDVTAVDPSEEMCASTQKVAGIVPILMRAEDLNFREEFDAIWACASLLHVSNADMGNVLKHCVQALKSGGYMYASWKYGDGERVTKGRRYSDYTERSLSKAIRGIINLKIVSMWKTADVRNNNATMWINVIVQKY